MLGIVPLGTYNNVAGCLGLPFDAAEACALIGAGPVRRIDVGRVTAQGQQAPPALPRDGRGGGHGGPDAGGAGREEGGLGRGRPGGAGRGRDAPHAGRRCGWTGSAAERQAHTLLVEVANAPLMGPAFQVAPHARMDDGLLDVAVYHDLTPAGLAARLVALQAGVEPDDERIERARVQRLELRTATPLPVMADSKVIGTTPARFEVLPGALRVIAGHGPGLLHPVGEALLEAAVSRAHAPSARRRSGGTHAGTSATTSRQPDRGETSRPPSPPRRGGCSRWPPAPERWRCRPLSSPGGALGGLAVLPALRGAARLNGRH